MVEKSQTWLCVSNLSAIADTLAEEMQKLEDGQLDGKCVVFVSGSLADRAVYLMHRHSCGLTRQADENKNQTPFQWLEFWRQSRFHNVWPFTHSDGAPGIVEHTWSSNLWWTEEAQQPRNEFHVIRFDQCVLGSVGPKLRVSSGNRDAHEHSRCSS